MKTQMHSLALAAAVVILMAVTLPASSTADKDDKIEAAFKNSYVFKAYLASDAIKIESKDGVVTLTGTVKQETDKPLAQETAQNLPGVTRVVNRLEVAGGPAAASGGANNDAWIAAKVRTSLLFHSKVSSGTGIDVKNGVVSLSGNAENLEQKNLTAEYAKEVDGVTGVKNEMTVGKTPPASASGTVTVAAPKFEDATAAVARGEQKMSEQIDDASITAQVKMALLLNRTTSSLKTKVTTNNGVVTLSGQVESMAEMNRALKLVSDVNGVKKVKNEMSVVPN